MPGLNLGQLVKAVKSTEVIITPRVNEWLMQHGDEAVPKDVMDYLYELMTTPPRVRSASFSASSAGQCHRRQVLGYLGVQETGAVSPQLQNIFNDGKWRHLRWQAMLLAAGILDDIERPLFWRKMRARGTMDGRGVVPNDHIRKEWRGKEFGFELKGVTPFLFPKLKKNDEAKEEHRQQVNRYFLQSGLDLFVIIYENKATQEFYEWVVEPDQKIIEQQRQELIALNKAVTSERLPPILPSCKAKIGPVFKECPYGGGPSSPCLRSGDWPRMKKESR